MCTAIVTVRSKWQIELEHDGDEEVVFQQSESSRSTTCPVTQLEMKKPLRKYVSFTSSICMRT